MPTLNKNNKKHETMIWSVIIAIVSVFLVV